MRNLLKKLFIGRLFLRKKLTIWQRVFENAGWDWTKGGIVLGLAVGTIVLIGDAYVSIDRAMKNYKSLALQEAKLQEEKKLGRELDEQLNYYASLEYKQRYAYDSLNLAREGEELYVVESREREQYSLDKPNPDPIKRDTPSLWWQLIWQQIIAGDS